MKQIMAPWRMDMIRAPKQKGCFLCEKQTEENQKENLVLEHGKFCYVLMNAYPYTNAHLLIAPYKHTGDIMELEQPVMWEMMYRAQLWAGVIKRCANPEAFNIGMNIGKAAGAGVAEHLHMHLVPRWSGDTNFMSVFSDARVINQALNETWEELKKHRNNTEKDAALADFIDSLEACDFLRKG